MKDRNDVLRRISASKGKLKPMLEAYQKLVDGAKTDKGEDRPFNAEETTQHVNLGTEINAINAELQADQAALRGIDLNNSSDDRTAELLGLSGRDKLPQASEAYFDAFLEFGRGGFTNEAYKAAFSGTDFKNLSTVSPSTGGVLIPTELEKTILFEAFSESPLLSISNVRMTNIIHGQIPFMGTVGVLGPRKEMEPYVLSEPALSVKAIDIYNYGGIFPISQELMEDADGLDAAFREVWGEAYSETIEEYGWKGATGQTAFTDQAGNAATITLAGRVCPGILPSSTGIIPAVANGSPTAVTADDIIKLKQAVKPSARNKGVYVFSTDFETKALLLKDTAGNPLWRPNLVAGQPAMLNGSPYYVSDRLDAVAASKTPALFGNFKKAHDIVIRKGLTVKRSDHFYFGNGAIAIACDVRWGSLVKYKNLIARLNTPAS